MTVSSTTLWGLLLFAVYVLITTTYQWFRLRHIPGPRFAGFSKWFWMVPNIWREQMPIELSRECRKYGELKPKTK